MGWVRNNDGGSSAIDTNATGQAVVRYLFDTFVDPVAIALNPQTFQGGLTGVELLPAKGSAHPLNPSFKLDTYNVRCNGQTAEVEALYSNDGRFQFPINPDDPDRLDSTHYSSSPEEVRVEYPFARRVEQRETLPAGFTGPPASTIMLQYGEKFILESMRRWSWEVIIKEQDILACEAAMDAQHNRIHKINGRYYRFQSGPIDFYGIVNDDKKYRAVYTWWGDSGTKDSLANPILPNVGSVGLGEFEIYFPQPTVGRFTDLGYMTRQPFHRFTLFDQSNVNTGNPMPAFHQFLPYVRDDFGWQSLVGL